MLIFAGAIHANKINIPTKLKIFVGKHPEKLKMVTCNICNSNFDEIETLVRHCRRHSFDPKVRYRCPFQYCKKICKSYSDYRRHVSTEHRRKVTNPTTVEKNIYRCNVTFCQKTEDTFKDLVKHLKAHLDSKVTISCPFTSCAKPYKVKSTFASHLSRSHSHQSIAGMSNANSSSALPVSADTETANVSDHTSGEGHHRDVTDEQEFSMMFNLFLVKLQVEHHVSELVIDEIVKACRCLSDYNNDYIICKVLKLIQRKDPEFNDERELCKLIKSDLFNVVLDDYQGVLRSKYMRSEYVKKNMKFIEPINIKLGAMKKNDFCHYVPLKSSLQNFLSDSTVKSQFESPRVQSAVYSDLHDGYVYKENDFFDGSRKLELLLYQDAFEVVNPLGASKNRHKLVGVYYTLANLHEHNRSNANSFQLLMLIKESVLKRHEASLIFKPLIDELRLLHEEGIDLGYKDRTRVGLLAVLGDNLGSHYVGGYTESFMAKQFCRYCVITREQFRNGTSLGEWRTPETYDEHANTAHNEGVMCHGIKSNSSFNEIPGFHVAKPGLPPCIAHDIYEGVLSYDLVLFLKCLCNEKKWVSTDTLNSLIVNFKYKSFDSLDKPPMINFKSKKLSGHAIQNSVLLRNINFILLPHVQDGTDAVWELLLLLRQIVLMISAPSMDTGDVMFMESSILLYLQLLRETFPEYDLKPKHHFMTHYGELVRAFGPLSKCSTLRMEAKHQFFKRCIIRSGNYINITKFAANKHSLLQAYYLQDCMFSVTLECENAIDFNANMYSEDIRRIVEEKLGDKKGNSTISSEVKFKGIRYKNNDLVILDVKTWKLVAGVIGGILVCENQVYFIVEEHDSYFKSSEGCYTLDASKGSSLIPLSELYDPMSLPIYCVQNRKCFNLKHSLVF